ncbi:zinc-ribbon domain-containing protein [Paracoccus sp. SSK6]|uniref:zinc-ribbon domain-containing protein n=1 Tax=Paracoccus sp. SSK6 TaxID=3143131 RepID=UPI00321A96AC
MAEIRLICPGCAAEYRLPENAIPPEGREVECSACGNVWQATAQPVGVTVADDLPSASALPPLNRRLPDTVLDILRDEVEHERRARAAEDGAPPLPAPASPPAASPRAAADPEWPATTITTAITPHVAPVAEVSPPLPQPSPDPASFLKRPAALGTTTSLPQGETPVQDQAPPAPRQPARPAPVPVLVPRPRRGGYAVGFGLAALLAAACVALYALAPVMADQGAFGEGLMQLRGQVDEARLWLQDRAASLTR